MQHILFKPGVAQGPRAAREGSVRALVPVSASASAYAYILHVHAERT